MKTKIKWILTVAVLLIAFVFAMLAPQAADRWYDRSIMGKLAYESVSYEPYEISYYSSFEDKLDAIAECRAEGEAPYVVLLEEGEEAPDDQALEEIVNEELHALYQSGILAQEITVERILDRLFYEMYVVPLSGGNSMLRDVCYWELIVQTDKGYISLALDSEFHKIYRICIQGGEQELRPEIQLWTDETQSGNGSALAEEWCRYWEFEKPAWSLDTETDAQTDADTSAATVAGGVMGRMIVVSKKQNEFLIVFNLIKNVKTNEWILETGLNQELVFQK